MPGRLSAALLGLGTIGWVGLWLGATLLANTYTLAPGWALGLLVSSSLWVPYGYVILMAFIIMLRKKREELKARHEAADVQQVLETPDLGIR